MSDIKKGYFGIGIFHGKNEEKNGTLQRTLPFQKRR